MCGIDPKTRPPPSLSQPPPLSTQKKKKKVFELLSSLPNYGAGSAKVARITWRNADKCFWSIHKASPSAAAAAASPKERPTGKAWGVLTWDGVTGKAGVEERPVRIPGSRKRVWRLVEEGGEGGSEGAQGWKTPPTS